MATSLKVAVIGAGVGGLTAARELKRESHQVVVMEQSNRVGGTWVYDPRVESDLLGLDPNREIVYGSLYKSLQTNLPRELMSFTDFKFADKEYGDPRMFPGHQEVLNFLQDFAATFQLTELIRFNTLVTQVEAIDSDTQFVVGSMTSGVSSVEVFDAVVVCNGHNTQPRPAIDIPGIETWPINQMHSHNYRVPEPFRDQIVVVIGSGPSGIDLSVEIAMVAKEVHMSSRSPIVKVLKLKNLWQHPKIEFINEDGIITFEDGVSVEADVIFHCTGYKLNFPFLKTNGIMSVQEKRVGPLYKHVFPPQLAPRLSFVGLPEKSLTFAIIECQSRWIAQALSRKIQLPTEDEMLSDVEEYYQELERKGLPEHYTHSLEFQTEYIEWVSAQSGMVVDQKRIKEMFKDLINCFMSEYDGYKDAFLLKYGK